MGRRRIVFWSFGILAVLLVTVALGLRYNARRAIGGRAEGSQLVRIERSPQWRDGKFRNRRPRVDGPFLEASTQFFFGGSEHRSPSSPIPVVPRNTDEYRAAPPTGLRVTWLGHSTSLIEIDGRRVLIDPVWGRRASPFRFAGPERYYRLPLPPSEAPPVDVVLISHDHYDHLDAPSIRMLAYRGSRFVVPLGIGAHLRAWAVPEAQIIELDWWEDVTIGGLKLTATPSRHFSGRWVNDQDRALWAGWSIAGPTHRVYYSGDTALDDTMIEIGTRLGPFDLTMIEVGEYDALWSDVHLGPEQAVRTHRLVRGRVMLPVHWGRFDLAMHGWTEPIERVLVAAKAEGVLVATPRPGERFEPSLVTGPKQWWPALPWKTAAEAPAMSTGVAHLMAPRPVTPVP